MPPKKRKKIVSGKKKAAKPAPRKAKKAASKKSAKKAAPKKAAPSTGLSARARPGVPCICIENEEGWFCMKRLPNGVLKECDGPFGSQEECLSHTCRK